MNETTDQPWGFWVIIRNEADAKFAIKMSGLLFFLAGASSLLVAASIALKQPHEIATTAIMITISVALIWSGLRIRKGKYGTFASSTLLFFLALCVHLLSEPLAINILGALQGILMLSGIRGWLYLRKTPSEEV